MEKINKYNYEAYFLDYLEGTLSAEEKHDLFIFLEQNPELKKELDVDFSDVSLDPSAVVFENKPALKVVDDEALALATVDTWMLESVEGNLSASKQQELDDFVRKHQLEKTYTAYQSTILKADLNDVFADKKKLKVATGIVIPMYARVASIAAVGIILVGIALNRFSGAETPVLTETATTRDYFVKTAVSGFATHHYNGLQNGNGTDENTVFTNSPNNHTGNEGDKTNSISPNEMLVETPGKTDDSKDTTGSQKMVPPGNDVVEQPKQKQDGIPLEDADDVVITSFNSQNKPSIVTEEPYKLVTNAASNITKREVQFTRDKNTTTNEYVAYGFKVGNFEFERKKSE